MKKDTSRFHHMKRCHPSSVGHRKGRQRKIAVVIIFIEAYRRASTRTADKLVGFRCNLKMMNGMMKYRNSKRGEGIRVMAVISQKARKDKLSQVPERSVT